MRKTTLCMIITIMVCSLTSGMGCVADDAVVPLEEVGSLEQEVTPAFNLTGMWGAATILQSGDSLTVTIPNRGTFQGIYIDPVIISVTFTDDPGCCTGTVSGGGEVIRWSNGSTWIKN
jgi:hypothetical protein